MKVSGTQNRGGGAPIGLGAYIRQWKFKFRGGSIQSKRFYCQEHPTAASSPSIIFPHLAQAGPSNDSNYDSTFKPTQYFSNSEESGEKSTTFSEISNNEFFWELNFAFYTINN